MKPRERLMRALQHQELDRVPIDIGTAVTSIHMEAYMRLKEYLGLDRTPPQILDPVQQVVEVEEPVLKRFKVDTRHIRLRAQRDWVKLPNGNFVDEWGIKYTKPVSSHYYDMYEYPLAQVTEEDLFSLLFTIFNPMRALKKSALYMM